MRPALGMSALGIAAIAACVGDDPATGGPDSNQVDSGEAPVDGSTPGDSGATSDGDAGMSAPCRLSEPFEDAVELTSLSSPADDFSPTLSANENTIFFVSRRSDAGGFGWVHTASRTDTSLPFDPPVELPAPVNTPTTGVFGLCIANDLNQLYFGALRDGTWDIFVAAKGTGEVWSAAKVNRIGFQDGGATEASPFIAVDKSLWFASNASGATNFQIMRAPNVGANLFAEPQLVGELSTDDIESDPVLSADGLRIYFTSTRPTSLGRDIWTAARVDLATGFGPATRVAELASTGDERPGWLSPDGCRLYFSSTKKGGDAGDLYVAEKPR